MSDSREWYLGEWRVFMNRKGVCPMTTATNSFGEKVATNCIRPSQAQASDIFVNVDDLNKADYSVHSNMKESFENLEAVSICVIVGIVVGAIVVALSVCIISTAECHTGRVVVFTIFVCVCPGILSLLYLLRSDMSSGTNWKSFFPSCDTIAVEYLTTPGMTLLFYQVGLFVLLEIMLLFSSLYIYLCKQRTNDEEDGIDMNFEELFLYREIQQQPPSTKRRTEMEYFTCGVGHRCRISFGLPVVYKEAGTMEGEISCKLCHRPHIDLKEMYAYFVYCEQCFIGEGLDTDNNLGAQNEGSIYSKRGKSRHDIMPNADRHFDICQICANEWRISGLTLLRESSVIDGGIRSQPIATTTSGDVHAII